MTLSFPQGHQPRLENFHLDALIDETLREGAERCLFAVDEDSKYRLIKHLIDAGVREVVVGSGPDDPNLLFRCLKAKLDLGRFPQDTHLIFIILLNSWEPLYEQLKHFPTYYLEDVCFSFGMVEYQQDKQLLERVVEKFSSLGTADFRVSLLNNFSTGVNADKYAAITHQIDRCIQMDFDVVRINDSLGRIHPETMAILAANLRHDYPVLNFCLHAHDDHGLGLANALASVYHGFNMIEGAIAGYGNRSGLPSLEAIEKICREKRITIGSEPLDPQKLVTTAHLADEVFMTLPAIYRAVSGMLVERENLGVLNIPDYLGIEREADYFLNQVGLHLNTVVKTLEGAQFKERFVSDPKFIEAIRSSVKEQMQTISEQKRKDFQILMHQIHIFYHTGVLTAADILETAEKCALLPTSC